MRPTRLAQRQALINRGLEAAVAPANGTPRQLREAIAYCLLSGGKRFRPLLTLGGCEAVGGTPQRALPVACAVELIHAYSLVHDDLPAMDNADERRGQPSCHRKYNEATAILVGDALLTYAFERLATAKIPNALAVIREIGYASGTSGLIGGQWLDLDASAKASGALEDIARRKTAALITASVVAGALAGNATPASITRLRRYGEALGLAFQLIDDLHDGDGLAAAHGSQRVHTQAIQLINDATEIIKPFGANAWLLRALAEWLARNGQFSATPRTTLSRTHAPA